MQNSELIYDWNTVSGAQLPPGTRVTLDDETLRAGKPDVHGLDAEGFHQMEDLDFLFDGWIVYGGILQAVAQSLVVKRHASAGRKLRSAHGVPIVDEFAVLHF